MVIPTPTLEWPVDRPRTRLAAWRIQMQTHIADKSVRLGGDNDLAQPAT